MKHRTKKIISYVITLGVIAVAGMWVWQRFVRLDHVEFTDNARIKQQIVPVNSRIQGYIKEIRFNEYEPVHRGDTLVIIDDADMRLNVARAQAEYDNARAGCGVAHRSAEASQTDVAVSEASIAEAKVLMDNAATDFERYRQLLTQEAVTRQEYDHVNTDYEAKRARYEMLCRQRNSSSSAVDVSRSRVTQSEAGMGLAKVALETARLNLSYTVIVAPCDGYVSRKEIQEGQLVQPGQTLVDIVDGSDIWVTANFKETQLRHIAPGSKVRIIVDALPGDTLTGEVKSISTATGADLSLMPQDNSSGNFVKVRQRVPVRIEFASNNNVAVMAKLRSGMNVECEIPY